MKLFVCYRPADLEEVERLHDGLTGAFGYDPVIRDLDAIPIPLSRKQRAAYLADWLRAASAVLVVIGPGWLEAIDARGRRRLRRRGDPVRWTIETAASLGIPLVPVLVGGARLPDAAALPRGLRTLLGRPAHAMRFGGGFEADVDGVAADLVRICDAPAHPVTQVQKRECRGSAAIWWEVRFRMGAEHSILYEMVGVPSACRLLVDGRVVWRSKGSFRRLPTGDVHFRIESENADGWLVMQDQSTLARLGQTVDLWIETTRILHLRRFGMQTYEFD